jgi:hypothetical protein
MQVIFYLPLLVMRTLAGKAGSKRDSWGGSVSLGPSMSTIVHAVTTIIPGVAPSTQSGDLCLWPGMSNGTGDLIQTVLDNQGDNSWCGATEGQWCAQASLFGIYGQLSGDARPVSGSDQVKIEYILESDNENWTQYVISYWIFDITYELG